MDILKALNRRYSTKVFDSRKQISAEDIEKIESILNLSPSSTNVQPWHFLIAESDFAKEKIAKASKGFFSFNEKKILDSSISIIFCSKIDIDSQYLEHLSENEFNDKRYLNTEAKEKTHKARETFVNFHKNEFNDLSSWVQKQLYLNLGFFLASVAALEIDAVPMEGLDMSVLDKEFNLTEKGFKANVVVSLGYHSNDDYNSNLPKSRLSKNEIIEKL